MSLAEELLADLEEEDDDDHEAMEEGDIKEEDAIDEISETPIVNMSLYDKITDVAKLTNSKE